MLSHTDRRCQDELKAFHGSAKEDGEIVSGKTEATERQRLCAGVRGGERAALQVGSIELSSSLIWPHFCCDVYVVGLLP